MIGNSLLRQKIVIPVEIDPSPFRANLFLYTYENEYMSELISNDKVKARHFHSTKCFIDNLGTVNDGEYSMMSTKTSISLNKCDAFHFLLFACLTLIVTSPNQYFILLLLVNFLE